FTTAMSVVATEEDGKTVTNAPSAAVNVYVTVNA
ncbi:unnamed protein product, partial [marine sediment metagenome]